MGRLRLRFLLSLVAVLLAASAVVACGGEDDDEPTGAIAEPGAPGEGGPPPDECEEVAAPEAKEVDLKAPKQKVKRGALMTATVSTSCGDFSFVLDTETSPKTVSSFVHLAEEGVYDDTAIHRIVPGFVFQGGDPEGTGMGGPGYSVAEEPPFDVAYTRGIVAMAKTGAEPPGTAGSQFFVVTAADAGLPPDYAILGSVTGGEDVMDRIEAMADPELGPEGGRPVRPVVIQRVEIEP